MSDTRYYRTDFVGAYSAYAYGYSGFRTARLRYLDYRVIMTCRLRGSVFVRGTNFTVTVLSAAFGTGCGFLDAPFRPAVPCGGDFVSDITCAAFAFVNGISALGAIGRYRYCGIRVFAFRLGIIAALPDAV